jgi:hypothetical protein
MVITVEIKYNIGQTVFLKTDQRQEDRLVYGYKVYRNEVIYLLTFGTQISEHYDFELTADRDQLKCVE